MPRNQAWRWKSKPPGKAGPAGGISSASALIWSPIAIGGGVPRSLMRTRCGKVPGSRCAIDSGTRVTRTPSGCASISTTRPDSATAPSGWSSIGVARRQVSNCAAAKPEATMPSGKAMARIAGAIACGLRRAKSAVPRASVAAMAPIQGQGSTGSAK
ncbi:MAG: hypothetical protein WDN69_33235 [Aliidongia sp.]